MAQMLIANRLGDGRVVFRAADDTWIESIAAGLLIRNDGHARRVLRQGMIDAADNLVIDPQLIGVTERAGRRVPDEIREAIRAAGPSIEVEA